MPDLVAWRRYWTRQNDVGPQGSGYSGANSDRRTRIADVWSVNSAGLQCPSSEGCKQRGLLADYFEVGR